MGHHREESKLTVAPNNLEVSIGGYMGDSFSIELHGETIKYRAYSQGHELARTATLKLSTKKWNAFLAVLDEINVWEWQPRYDEPALDGTSWSIRIEHGGRVVESSGSNGYPSDPDPMTTAPHPSTRFSALLSALSDLLGGRPIH